jgi:Skp family chaperone for outer membrane proteins
MRLGALILPALLVLAPLGAAAQEAGPAPGQVQSPVLTIDVERLLAETRFGQRVAEDLRARTEALAAENERLRIELTEEERSLTERRPTMEVEAFRAEADAFDARVQRIRAEQDAKQAALAASIEEDRRTFLNAVQPVLGRLMIESGAAVILERRDVFLSASLVDVTEEAISAIDAELGDGSAIAGDQAPEPEAALQATPSAPEAAPSPAEEPGPSVLSPEPGPPPAGQDGG